MNMDLKETGEKFKEGMKKIPTKQTAWMMAGTVLGLMSVATLYMIGDQMFGDKRIGGGL